MSAIAGPAAHDAIECDPRVGIISAKGRNVDLAKITCEQFMGEQLATPSRDIVLLLAGYYNGKRNNTIIEPQTIKKEDEKVNSYCYQHGDTTVMDAVKNVLGFDK